MKKTLMSIVTPSFNQGKYIGQTLSSILEQADPSITIEYFIYDALSQDSTDAVISSYIPMLRKKGIRVTYVREKDKGQSDAINKGLRRAKGEIVTYLNSDDYYEPGVLAKVAEYFRKHPGTEWAYGGWNVVNESGEVYKTYQHSRFSEFSFRSYASNIGQPACFFRNELLRKVGGFDEELHLAMDYDMWLRFLQFSPPQILPFLVANLRYYSGAKSAQNMVKHNLQAFQVARKYAGSSLPILIHLFGRFLLGYFSIVLRRNISQKIS